MKEEIRRFALAEGADAVGFASIDDYDSPNSPPIEKAMVGARSLIVMAYRELATCESESPELAMNGRLDLMEYSRSLNYKVGRFVEGRLKGRAVTVPVSYPIEMSAETKGVQGVVSLRHAALAAGLGAFGRHNLIIHPELGTRVVFTAVLTDLELSSDPKLTESPCTNCDLCVESCPAGALDEEGKTQVMRCLKNSQPYGIGGAIKFGMELVDADADKKKELLKDPHFWKLYQAGFIGFQYFCFNCLKSCPIGR